MADKCTDITTVWKNYRFFRWEENGSPIELFVELAPLTKADEKSISTSASEIKTFNILGWGSSKAKETCST